MDIIEALDIHERVRDAAWKMMRDNPEILGNYQWLKNAISTRDMQMIVLGDDLSIWGYTYTTQTMSSESFEFEIPMDELKRYMGI